MNQKSLLYQWLISDFLPWKSKNTSGKLKIGHKQYNHFRPPLKIQILIFFKLKNSCKSKIRFYKKYNDRKSAVITKCTTFSIDFWLDKIRMKNFWQSLFLEIRKWFYIDIRSEKSIFDLCPFWRTVILELNCELSVNLGQNCLILE